MNIYEWADYSFNSSPNYAIGFTQLLASDPYIVPPKVFRSYDSRLQIIRDFQKIALRIFRNAIDHKTSPHILHWLLNETPKSLGLDYHRNLKDCHYTLPIFFRTDEATFGKITEIQCPGSLWGELQLTFDHMKTLYQMDHGNSPANRYANQLYNFLHNEQPIVHHLLDNSSSPAGMRYFNEKTRPMVKYWGIDKDIRPDDCNFIRSHSFFGLCAENEFRNRLVNVGDGITYDLPPHVLFDQKASLVLPFWSLTRELFSDKIRDLFPFTTPLLPTGIELPEKGNMTIENFSRLPRSQRSYYLKYAGSNVAINWGSKAVFRMNNMSGDSCYKLLKNCLSQYENGQIWLLQEAVAQNDNITILSRDNTTITENLRAKFSGFYGPTGCLGILAMHRLQNKVHGQKNTVISYVTTECKNRDNNVKEN